MKYILELFFRLFFPLVYLIHKKAGYNHESIMRKCGNFSKPDFNGKKVIMFHGVSVGEINAVEKLIKETRKEFTNVKIVVTTGTNTGQEIAHKKLAETADIITYFPFDTFSCVTKFLDKIRPDVVLMMETEIWPIFVDTSKKWGIKLCIINGRISDRTFNSYKKFKFFFKSLLRNYAGIYTQSEEDLNKFIQLGSAPDRTERMNNLKFDITAPAVDCNLDYNGRIILAASTHSGEDIIILNEYRHLKDKHSDLKLVIAPRHLQRVHEVEQIIKTTAFSYGFRSKNDNLRENDILILDTMGELGKIFNYSYVSFIGGSFNKTGGHNPLESVIFGKPVISGPSIHNFKDIYSIITNAGAGYVVKDSNELYKITDLLLSDSHFYNDTANACTEVFNSQQGALSFVINRLHNFLD